MAKYCSNCGYELREGAKFCEKCGEAVIAPADSEISGNEILDETPDTEKKIEPETPEKPKRKRRKTAEKPIEAEKISENITHFSDGTYRWRYDMSLFKNPTIFLLIWKIFFFIILGIFTFIFFVSLGQKNFFWEGFLNWLKPFGIALGVMTGVVLLGYLLYAAIMGGKYCVEFEMNEKGIMHKQTDSQAKKAKKLAALTAIAGAASRRPTTVGVGINAARTERYTEFEKVRKVQIGKVFKVIKIREFLSTNHVYTEKEDFEFVKEFIISHCPNLKSKNKK